MYRLTCLLIGCVVWATAGHARAEDSYTQHQNIVYTESFGVGLVMDVFVPTGEKNGLAIVDIVSGAWHSDRGKIEQHKMAQMYEIFCKRGYTVFGVRPGSITKFTGLEMLKHIQEGVRWVKEHADEYDIDPERLGMTGASAGGHLGCLAGVASVDTDAAVKAIAVFFPPTDLIEYAGGDVNLQSDARINTILSALGFNGRIEGVTEEQATKRLTLLSPARRVSGKEPPFLLIHGDADNVVPLKQSELMVDALKEKGVPVKLIVKPGGGHPWPTINEEVAVIADWMDQELKAEGVAPNSVGN